MDTIPLKFNKLRAIENVGFLPTLITDGERV